MISSGTLSVPSARGCMTRLNRLSMADLDSSGGGACPGTLSSGTSSAAAAASKDAERSWAVESKGLVLLRGWEVQGNGDKKRNVFRGKKIKNKMSQTSFMLYALFL